MNTLPPCLDIPSPLPPPAQGLPFRLAAWLNNKRTSYRRILLEKVQLDLSRSEGFRRQTPLPPPPLPLPQPLPRFLQVPYSGFPPHPARCQEPAPKAPSLPEEPKPKSISQRGHFLCRHCSLTCKKRMSNICIVFVFSSSRPRQPGPKVGVSMEPAVSLAVSAYPHSARILGV